jgi:anthranilate phosphoribosyltransferase
LQVENAAWREKLVQEIAEKFDLLNPRPDVIALNALRELAIRVERETLERALAVVCEYNVSDGKTANELRRLVSEVKG